MGENEKVGSAMGCLLSIVRFGKERKQGGRALLLKKKRKRKKKRAKQWVSRVPELHLVMPEMHPFFFFKNFFFGYVWVRTRHIQGVSGMVSFTKNMYPCLRGIQYVVNQRHKAGVS